MFFTVLYQSQSVNKKKKSINYPPKLDFLVRKLTAKTAKNYKTRFISFVSSLYFFLVLSQCGSQLTEKQLLIAHFLAVVFLREKKSFLLKGNETYLFREKKLKLETRLFWRM